MAQGYADDKELIQKRLRRVEGQVRGLQRMVEEDRYCIDILEQVSAVTRALQSVALELLDDHLGHCVADAVKAGGTAPRPSSTRRTQPSPDWCARDRWAGRTAGRPVLPDGDGRALAAPAGWTPSGAACARASSCSGRPCGPSSSGSDCRERSRPSSAARPCRPSWETTDRPPWPGPRSIGMVSSSCSYAATAMAKSLFVKGADFVASMVFMFASTNLVIELGIVLVVLMGWQFALSEFVGGIIMIVLLSLLGGLWLRGRQVVEARARLNDRGRPRPPARSGRRTPSCSTSPGRRGSGPRAAGPTPPPSPWPISPCSGGSC